MQNVPEVRLIATSDDADAVFYAVIKGPHGWYGAPGLRKGQFLTDADVADAIPLQPGPSAVVDVAYSPGVADRGEFGDGSTCDVDVNGKPAARRVSSFVAGAFVVSAAVQKGEPIMVRAIKKPDGPTLLRKTPPPALSLVRDNQDGG